MIIKIDIEIEMKCDRWMNIKWERRKEWLDEIERKKQRKQKRKQKEKKRTK